jgi:hypothetical protein
MHHNKLLITLMVSRLPPPLRRCFRASPTAARRRRAQSASSLRPARTGSSTSSRPGKSAAALGDHLAITRMTDTAEEIGTIKSLVARHAAAIGVGCCVLSLICVLKAPSGAVKKVGA